MDRGQVAEALRRYFTEHPENVVFAYLYGSVARGEARASSDIDVAVLLERMPESIDGLGEGLASELSRALGREVDVAVLNRAPVDLAYRVVRDGIVLLDRDSSARAAYEARVRGEYIDLLPYLRQYRRSRLAST